MHEVDLNKITVPHCIQFLFSLQLLSLTILQENNNLLKAYFSSAVLSAELK